MIDFKGFPAKMRFTPIPNIVFSALLPQITDINELKVLLHIFEIVYPKKGKVRFVSNNELMCHAGLVSSIKGADGALTGVLEALVNKGVILHLAVEESETAESIYFFNSEANRLIIDQIRSGEITISGLKPGKRIPVTREEEPDDIFTLYEQNIGILTPLIADELREAEKEFPADWIRDAIKESVTQNKRSWRYIARILETWSTKGKDDGTYRGDYKKNTDPDKYIKGRYGHMVQR
jgi:DnaD/phage-associated family protein